jgi:hypothetical protein
MMFSSSTVDVIVKAFHAMVFPCLISWESVEGKHTCYNMITSIANDGEHIAH